MHNRLPLVIASLGIVGVIFFSFQKIQERKQRDSSAAFSDIDLSISEPRPEPPSSRRDHQSQRNAPFQTKQNITITQSEFDRKFDLALEDNLAGRSNKLSLLVLNAASSGFGDHALAKVLEVFGDGRERSHLIEICFVGISDTKELEELFSRLSRKGDIEAARSGILTNVMSSLSSSDGTDLSGLSSYDFAKDIDGFGFDLAFSILRDKYFGPSEGERAPFQSIFSAIDQIGLSSDDKSRLLVKFSELCPFECWEAYSELDRNDDGTLAKLASMMSRKDPEAASKLLAQSSYSGEGLTNAIAAWLNLDSKRPRVWVNEYESILAPERLDWIKLGVLQFDLNSDNGGHAPRDLLSDIKNPDVKKRGENLIESFERESIRNQTLQNPIETIESLVNGTASVRDYLLEEAMYTWVSNDFDVANRWYETNWDSMPEKKAQFLAAAFARRAVNQGDFDLANQWTSMIQDPETRERIESNISDAER